jgi:hypothetical protein
VIGSHAISTRPRSLALVPEVFGIVDVMCFRP